VTGTLFIFFPSGADHTVRAGRVSWWRGVLWLDGVGRDEAHHGARSLLIARSAPFIFPQGIDPLLFFGGATLGCMGMCRRSSNWTPRSPSLRITRCRISPWPYNRLDALARNAPAHHGPHRGTGPRVPSPYCQEPRRPYSTERYESRSRLLW